MVVIHGKLFFGFRQTFWIVSIALGMALTLTILFHTLPFVVWNGSYLDDTSSSYLNEEASIWPTTIITTISNAEEEKKLISLKEQKKERKILFVHVGKAGGMTFRYATTAWCTDMFGRPNQDAVYKNKRLPRCCHHFFNQTQNKLAWQTREVFHMWVYNETIAKDATSYLIPLRNPLDRAISAYRYAHPANCPPNFTIEEPPNACVTLRNIQRDKQVRRFFQDCFPSPSMEELAQSAMGPFLDDHLLKHIEQRMEEEENNNNRTNPMTPQERNKIIFRKKNDCRRLGRNVLDGTDGGGVPHLWFNYQWYIQKTMWKFPDKEILGLRTTHEWEDMKHLDVLLGGTGSWNNTKLPSHVKSGKKTSHGSEGFAPSPLSKSAVEKLCCVLHKEITIYFEVIERVINLTPSEKKELIQDVHDKCGLSSPPLSWQQWKLSCQDQLRKDMQLLSQKDT